MVRRMIWRAFALALFAAAAAPAFAAEAYQYSTISALVAGGYDGEMTVGQLLRYGGFGLGTFNGVDGEMMVLDGKVYRGTIDGQAHPVADSEQTPFAVVAPFSPQGSMPVAAGQSLRSTRCPIAHRVSWRCESTAASRPSRSAASPGRFHPIGP